MPAQPGDIAAELERDLKQHWPLLLELARDPQRFLDWLSEWQTDHGYDEDDIEAAMSLIGLGLFLP